MFDRFINLINKYWLWFVVLVTPLTVLGSYGLYMAFFYLKPSDILNMWGWETPDDVLETLEVRAYVYSAAIFLILLVALIPMFFLIFLRLTKSQHPIRYTIFIYGLFMVVSIASCSILHIYLSQLY